MSITAVPRFNAAVLFTQVTAAGKRPLSQQNPLCAQCRQVLKQRLASNRPFSTDSARRQLPRKGSRRDFALCQGGASGRSIASQRRHLAVVTGTTDPSACAMR